MPVGFADILRQLQTHFYFNFEKWTQSWWLSMLMKWTVRFFVSESFHEPNFFRKSNIRCKFTAFLPTPSLSLRPNKDNKYICENSGSFLENFSISQRIQLFSRKFLQWRREIPEKLRLNPKSILLQSFLGSLKVIVSICFPAYRSHRFAEWTVMSKISCQWCQCFPCEDGEGLLFLKWHIWSSFMSENASDRFVCVINKHSKGFDLWFLNSESCSRSFRLLYCQLKIFENFINADCFADVFPRCFDPLPNSHQTLSSLKKSSGMEQLYQFVSIGIINATSIKLLSGSFIVNEIFVWSVNADGLYFIKHIQAVVVDRVLLSRFTWRLTITVALIQSPGQNNGWHFPGTKAFTAFC